MAENLAYKAESGCWAYDNDKRNVSTYGYLYNWKTANEVCPAGWHLPSNKEWSQLTDFLGGELVAGTKMKSKKGWDANGSGTNSSGFSGIGGGFLYEEAFFEHLQIFGYWWSSTEKTATKACCRLLSYENGEVFNSDFDKKGGFSVRCVRD